MLSQVELGRPRGEVFPSYREAALPSSQQEVGGLERPCQGPSTQGARWMGAKAGSLSSCLVLRGSLPYQACVPCVWNTKAIGEGALGSSLKH